MSRVPTLLFGTVLLCGVVWMAVTVDEIPAALIINAGIADLLGEKGSATNYADALFIVLCMLLAAGIGVGISSSVIPYVCDQLAMARLPRATFALLLALLPATAALIGVVVLRQIPTHAEMIGIALVIAGVALHRSEARSGEPSTSGRSQ